MFRTFIAYLLCMALGLRANAQIPLNGPHIKDSLLKALQLPVPDTTKAKIYFDLLYFYIQQDSVLARQYLDEGRKLCRRNPYLTALSYSYEGFLYYASDMTKSEAAYKTADTLLQPFHTPAAYRSRSDAVFKYAVIQQRKDDDAQYLEIVLNRALPLAEKSGDSVILGAQYSGVGIGFMNVEQYDKAAIYLDKAITILKQTHADKSRLVAVYTRAGENDILRGKYEAARSTLDSIRPLLASYPQSELWAGYYFVAGLYFHNTHRYAQAIDSYDQGLKKTGGPNKVYITQELLLAKVKTLLAAKQFLPAREILLTLAADETLMDFAASRQEIFEDLSKAYVGLGNTAKAYEWLSRSTVLKDSLTKTELVNNLNKLELKYRTAQQEKKILTLEAEKRQSDLRIKSRQLLNWLLGTLTALLVITCVFLIALYSGRKKLSQEKEINHQQQLDQLKQQQELAVAHALLEGQETERRRVARDLHDGLGGMLSGIKLKLSTPAHMAPQNIDTIILQLDQSVTELRRIARDLMPESLLKTGLEAALRDLCESLGTDALTVEFQAFGIRDTIPPATQANIYRIIQEILSNAVRHAAASKIIVQCSQNDGIFLITAEDNGKGFDTRILEQVTGIGFHNIKSRVAYLNGRMDIASSTNEGTSINIELHVA